MCDMVSASDAVPGWVLPPLKRRLKGDFWDCCPSFSMSSFVSLVILRTSNDSECPNDRNIYCWDEEMEAGMQWCPRGQIYAGRWASRSLLP